MKKTWVHIRRSPYKEAMYINGNKALEDDVYLDAIDLTRKIASIGEGISLEVTFDEVSVEPGAEAAPFPAKITRADILDY